jgi:hypothetical protein
MDGFWNPSRGWIDQTMPELATPNASLAIIVPHQGDNRNNAAKSKTFSLQSKFWPMLNCAA